MALASYGRPVHLERLRETIRATADGGFEAPVPGLDRLRARAGPAASSDWPPLVRRPRLLGAGRASRRCSSTSPAGCTSGPATGC